MLKSLHVSVAEKELEAVKDLSRQSGLSLSAVVRVMVAEYLRRHGYCWAVDEPSSDEVVLRLMRVWNS